jgi:hypothetical protein
LGTYTYGEETTPAIFVDDGTFLEVITDQATGEVEVRPAIAPDSVTGLEVVIQPAIDSPTQQLLKASQADYKTTITLKQWDLGGNTLEASDRLISGLPNIERIGPRVLRNSALDNIESRTLTLSDSFISLRRN